MRRFWCRQRSLSCLLWLLGLKLIILVVLGSLDCQGSKSIRFSSLGCRYRKISFFGFYMQLWLHSVNFIEFGQQLLLLQKLLFFFKGLLYDFFLIFVRNQHSIFYLEQFSNLNYPLWRLAHHGVFS